MYIVLISTIRYYGDTIDIYLDTILFSFDLQMGTSFLSLLLCEEKISWNVALLKTSKNVFLNYNITVSIKKNFKNLKMGGQPIMGEGAVNKWGERF